MQNFEKNKVMGWYEPHSRETDYTGEVIDALTGQVTRPPSMTKQEFKDECDINNIVKEYLMTGQIAHINAKAAQGVFTDLPDAMDYQMAVEVSRQADQAFAQLPSGVRNRFENDPQQFLAFMDNPDNQEEMIALGLAKDLRPPPEPPKADDGVVPPVPPKA